MALVNPFGALGLEGTLQKIALFLQQLAGTLSRMYPDSSGRMRVSIDAGTLPTLTNQAQQSGYSTAYDQHAQMVMQAQVVRNQIKVSSP